MRYAAPHGPWQIQKRLVESYCWQMQVSEHPLLLLLLLLLRRCKTLSNLKSIHAQATTLGGFHPSLILPKILYTLTSLLSSSISPSSSIQLYAISLFDHIPTPSTFPHNLLIRTLTLSSSPLPALRLFSRMRAASVPPDSHTFPFVLTACARLPDSSTLGRALHSQSLRFGFSADPFVANSLLHTYASSGSILDAHRLFDGTHSRDVVSYNTLIDGYVKSGNITVARNLFDEMPVRDVVSWGTLLAGYSQQRLFHDALDLFDRMLAEGVKPDDVALVCALSCCAQLGVLDRGKAIHEYVKSSRVEPNVYLSTGLVDMYAKCGCIVVAREIFESSACRNLFTWNAMIVGLAMHGYGELSLDYFDRMLRSGICPDGVTFLGVLVGCSHGGLTGTARKFFDEMERVYGVERELKHYGCMADLLGRAGLIKEAMEMIDAMPMEGDVYVWGGILGGCRIHGNVEVAEIAAGCLLELNPGDSGIYSIMANIYATANRWEDVARVRRLMNEREVKKNVACSSIQVGGVSDGQVAENR